MNRVERSYFWGMEIVCKKYYYVVRHERKEYEIFITKQDKYLDMEVLSSGTRTEHGALYQDLEPSRWQATFNRMIKEHETKR